MQHMLVGFHDQVVRLNHADDLTDMVNFLFAAHRIDDAAHDHSVSVTRLEDGRYRMRRSAQPEEHVIERGHVAEYMMDAVIRGLVTELNSAVVIHAGAVAQDGKSLLVAGGSGAGKSTLIAWLTEQGYDYFSDELVALPLDTGKAIPAFARPLKLRHDALAAMQADGYLEYLGEQLQGDDKLQMKLPVPDLPFIPEPAMILFPHFIAGADLRLRVLDAGKTSLALLQNNLNGENLPDGGLARLSHLARGVPAFALEYGDTVQLEGVLDTFLAEVLEAGEDAPTLRKRYGPFSAVAPAAPAVTHPPTYDLNAPTPDRGAFPLTIGMATYDDYDGVFFTLQSLRLNSPELLDEIEFLIIDNNPTGPCAKYLKKLENIGQNIRYVPYVGQSGTAVRDFVFSEATGTHVLCMDCHVLLAPDALERLVQWFADNPDSRDLFQGPMLYDGLETAATHFEPVWRSGMYGTWAESVKRSELSDEPFEIPMQGLGLFACRRDAWPGFNPAFRGFGGEEGYIHEKFRQRGDKTLCLPFLEWVHRFARPMGIPYKPIWEDRIRNYLIGFRELGLPEESIIEHFSEHVNADIGDKVLARVDSEFDSPFTRFGMMACINLDSETDRWRQMTSRLTQLGIAGMVRRFPAISTPERHHIGCALSHRALIADAKQRGLDSILVFEDDALFRDDTVAHMTRAVEELDRVEWDLFMLGGHAWGKTFDLAPGCQVLQPVRGVTTTHAIAYHARVFDRILDTLPATHDAMADWQKSNRAIDQFLALSDFRMYLMRPMLAVQKTQLSEMPDEERDHFHP